VCSKLLRKEPAGDGAKSKRKRCANANGKRQERKSGQASVRIDNKKEKRLTKVMKSASEVRAGRGAGLKPRRKNLL